MSPNKIYTICHDQNGTVKLSIAKPAIRSSVAANDPSTTGSAAAATALRFSLAIKTLSAAADAAAAAAVT
jgi:hypothetical protein